MRSQLVIHNGRGKVRNACGQAVENHLSYTHFASTVSVHTYPHRDPAVHNHQVTNISHTVFTQPNSIFLSVSDRLYTLSTYPTNKTINSNNI